MSHGSPNLVQRAGQRGKGCRGGARDALTERHKRSPLEDRTHLARPCTARGRRRSWALIICEDRWHRKHQRIKLTEKNLTSHTNLERVPLTLAFSSYCPQMERPRGQGKFQKAGGVTGQGRRRSSTGRESNLLGTRQHRQQVVNACFPGSLTL